jgi:hypothetical protein
MTFTYICDSPKTRKSLNICLKGCSQNMGLVTQWEQFSFV